MSTKSDIFNRVIIECDRCKAKLRVPTGKVGVIECPRCQLEFNADTRDDNDLTNCDRPKEYDVVLGGESLIPFNSAVLGGLEGVKYRLKSDDINIQTAALSEAINYGKKGFDLLMETINHVDIQAQVFAYKLLQNHNNDKKVQQFIENFNHFKLFSCNAVLQGHLDYISSIVISSDDKTIASCGQDKSIRIWDVKTGELLKTLTGHSDWIHSIKLTKGNKSIVSCSSDKTIKFWDLKSGQIIKNIECEQGVSTIAINQNEDMVISGNEKGDIEVWDFQTGELLSTSEGHIDYISSIAMRFDDNIIVSGSYDFSISAWYLVRENKVEDEYITLLQYLYINNAHSDYVTSVSINPKKNIIISGSCDETIKIWCLYTGELLKVLKEHTDIVTSLSISQDGKFIISGSCDKTIKIWNFSTGELLHTIENSLDNIHSVAISSQNNIILTGSKNEIRLWELNAN